MSDCQEAIDLCDTFCEEETAKLPLEIFSRPEIISNNVLFPDPDFPTIANFWFFLTSRLIFFKISFSLLNTLQFKSEKIYGDGNAGKRIAEILSKAKVNIQKKLNYKWIIKTFIKSSRKSFKRGNFFYKNKMATFWSTFWGHEIFFKKNSKK